MATDLRANDTIQVRVPQGGGSVRDVPLSELNEYISTEEAAGITALETYVGDYSSPAGGEGSDIATDLATVYGSVETAETGLNARTDDLETAVGTYSGAADIATDLAAALGDIDDLEAVAPQYVATFATATAATATYTTDTTNPAVGSSVIVNDQTYRFMDTMTQANDVQIGVDADNSLGNLVAAINLGGTPGIEYYAGTVAAAGVNAASVGSHATVVTADTKGTAANAYRKGASTDPDSHIDVDVTDPADKFSGGVNGQVGATGKIIFTASAVYCCTDGTKCVITDSSGWKSAALSGG
jgi:hypothetical protein